MKFLLILTLGFSGVFTAYSQQLSLPEIISVLDLKHSEIDTLMKRKGYELMQTERDSLSTLRYFTSVEKNTETPTWVRSITIVDATEGMASGRIVSYRTYNSDEYRQIMAYMLAQNYHSKDSYEFNNAKHTVFENKSQSVRLKVTNNRLKNGKFLKGYEFEVGK